MKSAYLKISVGSLFLTTAMLITPAQQESAEGEQTKKVEVVERKSVFEEPLHPPYTDPFFPQSERMPYRARPTVTSVAQPKVATIDQIILRGVSGTGYALINRRTFAVGESGTVQTPRGPINIEVLEVKERSAIIKIENDPEPKEIHLRPEP